MTTKKNDSYIKIIFDGVTKLYKVNKKLSWLLIIVSLLSMPFNLLDRSNPPEPQATSTGDLGAGEVMAGIVIGFFVILCFAVLGIIIQGMVSFAIYKATKNQKPTVKEAFQVAKEKFWILLLVNIIVFFKVLGGLILFIIPGIRAICRYTLSPVIVFDKDMSAKEVIEYSKDLTKDNLLIIFLSLVLSTIIFPISALIEYGSLVSIYPWLNKKHKVAKA